MSNSTDEIEIYLDENSFCSFPSVVLIDDNKVLVAFRKAGNFSLKAGSDNNPTHHDNDSCICLITSTDGGQSYNKDDIQIVTKLKEFSFSIRKVLSKKIVMKFLPKLFFVKDNSFDYAEKIENLIKQTNK